MKVTWVGRAENGADVLKTITVLVDTDSPRKRFLGGFRDRKTGLEYHHASSQTYRKPGATPSVCLLAIPLV
jgi:hypothetical protein